MWLQAAIRRSFQGIAEGRGVIVCCSKKTGSGLANTVAAYSLRTTVSTRLMQITGLATPTTRGPTTVPAILQSGFTSASDDELLIQGAVLTNLGVDIKERVPLIVPRRVQP